MKLTYKQYLSKVHGGWLGKCLGGAAGAPVEGFKKIIECEDYKTMMRPDLPNDDLDLQLLWLEVLQKKGFGITAKDLADAWDRQCWYPFNEYGIFLKNYERGIWPPYSGSFNNPLFSEGEGCPIRSEIWGMLFPGEPETAAEFAEMDGCIDHAGEAVWIEQYYAAVEAQAFFETDMRKLLTGQLHFLPPDSKAKRCADDVLTIFKEGNSDWQQARTLMMRKYAHFDFTNAVTNLGIVLIALLYGKMDMDTIINIAFRSGYDTDCTCATAGAIFGIMIGEKAIPENLKILVKDEFVTGIKLKRTDMSISKLAEETCELGVLAEKFMIENAQDGRTQKMRIEVCYKGVPAIGIGDSCKFGVKLINETDNIVKEVLSIDNLPADWMISKNEEEVNLLQGESKEVEFLIKSGAVKRLENTNLLKAVFGKTSCNFGIAGASEWKAIGPYFEALDKKDDEGIPSAHSEDCMLPTLECMVNNAAYLNKEYIDETDFASSFINENPVRIHGYEDLLCLDDAFMFKGQGCIYIMQELLSPEAREAFAVIGNNDGFKLWINRQVIFEKDEIRLWTPYNNYKQIPLKEGKNQIVIKLLRRTESLKFSFALRKYNGNHFHRNRWYTDFACE